MSYLPNLAATLFTILFLAVTAFSQTTAFNFQGRMNDGASPANGQYDLRFKLFDAISGGSQIGATVDKTNTTLVNGVFSTPLDFGAAVFTTGTRFLEISVRPFNSPNAHVILGARQQILAVPLAVRATSAGNADTAVNATNAANAVNAQNAFTATSATTSAQADNALALGGVAAGGFARLNVQNSGNVVADNVGAANLLQVGGNTLQPAASNGLVKAMVEVTRPAGGYTIAKCYNGVTGATTNGCGFTVGSNLPGVVQVSFGFPVVNRFVTAMAQINSGVTSTDRNFGINYNYPAGNPNTIEFFSFENDNPDDTTAIFGFIVILF